MNYRSEKPIVLPLAGVPDDPDKYRMRDDGCGPGDGVAVIGISRHRLATDGRGVTTLVAFHGCPLRCRYCLNKDCWVSEESFRRYTPQSLYDEVKADDLYFRATGGGITFGGGEPCLQADFIEEFRRICGPDWKIRVETSLNVPRRSIVKLAPVVDEWIVDIKAESSETYKKYTGAYPQRTIGNLNFLTSTATCNIPKSRFYLRVPVIPGFVDEAQAEETRKMYADVQEFPNVEVFRYVTDEERNENLPEGRGRRVCDLLKDIRRELALANGLKFTERECTHQGECAGSCPLCEMETAILMRQLEGKRISVSSSTLERIDEFDRQVSSEYEEPGGQIVFLQGDIRPEEGMEWQPEYRYKEIFFKECAVAGVSFHLENDDELWDELEEGTELALIRQRDNKHDSKAVAVALAGDYDGDPDNFDFNFILGYIPRSENAELAAMMDAGYADRFSARITTFRRFGSYNDRIRLTIYIKSDKPEVVRPDLLRAESLSRPEFREMVGSLDERGVAFFRWGCFNPFIPQELQSLLVGEKVVIVHRDNGSDILYLMRVLATGEGCEKYVKDPKLIDCYDDCVPYVLTNVMGPLRIKKSDWSFLRGVDLCGFSATGYLSPYLSRGFNLLFNSRLWETPEIEP